MLASEARKLSQNNVNQFVQSVLKNIFKQIKARAKAGNNFTVVRYHVAGYLYPSVRCYRKEIIAELIKAGYKVDDSTTKDFYYTFFIRW